MSAAYDVRAESQPFTASREKLEGMIAHLGSGSSMAQAHNEVEDYLQTQGRQLLRQLLQDHLDLRSLQECERQVHDSNGVERRRCRQGETRKLRSLFGDVQVTRRLYQQEGCEALAPLDASLNLPPELYSFGLRRLIAREVACNSYEHAKKQLERYSAATMGKRQVEELASRAAADFDAFYEARTSNYVQPNDDAFLVLTFDGACIRVRTEDLRDDTRDKRVQAEATEPRWPAKQGDKGHKHKKRRAMVAAVYDVSPFPRTYEDIIRDLRPVCDADKQRRPRPMNKRAWASVVRDCRAMIDDGFATALERDPEMKRTWVCLVDGDAHQLAYIRQRAKQLGVEVVLLLDVIHVLGYLWDAANCFYPEDGAEAQQWVIDRLQALLTGSDPSQVAAGIRRSATRRRLARRGPVDTCATYLRNNRAVMGYQDALRRGTPIATGVIEGACRYLVRDRLDKTGARWSVVGAEAILRLRALETNGDFDEYWRFHVATEYRFNHAARFRDGKPPAPDAKSTLRLVK